jgi:metal-responsive CopG/Arc/MetJ family transcriptional regulator
MNRWEQLVTVCCRDLRRFLETALKTTKGGVVTVKMRRLLRAELSLPDRARYAHCLSRVLHAYRWKSSTYVIPRQDAEKLLESFDSLCESARQVKAVEKRPWPKRRQKEEFVFISVAMPNDLLHAIDEYARRRGLSRSEVIRRAIQQLIEMRHMLEELDKAKNGDLEIVALRLPRDLLTALNEHAATLKATRSAVIRYAIHMLLQRINAALAP